MRDRSNRPVADTPLTVVIFPGASLMNVHPLTDDMTVVRCPGCGACRLFTSRPADGAMIAHVAFVHEDDACPILARIEAALAGLRARAARAAEKN